MLCIHNGKIAEGNKMKKKNSSYCDLPRKLLVIYRKSVITEWILFLHRGKITEGNKEKKKYNFFVMDNFSRGANMF